MNGVNKTLYIPLYGKAHVSEKGLFLDDKKAEEIWKAEGFALKGKSKSKWLAYYMGIRSAVFDDWLRQQMADTEEIAVIHIGCGMDSRVLRVGTQGKKWYDVDFPQVIEERKRYYAETTDYQMLAGDVREAGWLASVPKQKRAIVVMEGVSMYLSFEEVNDLTAKLCNHFEQFMLLMDSYSVLEAKMSKHKNPINDVGVTKVYGIDNPNILENENFIFIKEHEITPTYLINYLSGVQKFIFKKMYAGKLAKKLYKIYEFKSFTNVKSLQN